MKGEHVANIGSRGRRRRLLGGVFWLILGAIGTVIVARARAASVWYVLLVIPFSLAALGYFQSRAHT